MMISVKANMMLIMVVVHLFTCVLRTHTCSYLNTDGNVADLHLPHARHLAVATLSRLRRSMYVCDSDDSTSAEPFPGFLYSITNTTNNRVEGYGIGSMHVPPILLQIPMEKKCNETEAATSPCTLTMVGPMGQIINASSTLYNEIDLLNTTFLAALGGCAGAAGELPSVEDQTWNMKLVAPMEDIIRLVLAELNDDNNNNTNFNDNNTNTNNNDNNDNNGNSTTAIDMYVQQLTSNIPRGGMAVVNQILQELLVTHAILQQYGRQGLAQSTGIGRTLDQIVAQQAKANGGTTAGLESLERTCSVMQDLAQLHTTNTDQNKTTLLQGVYDLRDSLASHEFVNPFVTMARAYSCGNFTALREMIENDTSEQELRALDGLGAKSNEGQAEPKSRNYFMAHTMAKAMASTSGGGDGGGGDNGGGGGDGGGAFPVFVVGLVHWEGWSPDVPGGTTSTLAVELKKLGYTVKQILTFDTDEAQETTQVDDNVDGGDSGGDSDGEVGGDDYDYDYDDDTKQAYSQLQTGPLVAVVSFVLIAIVVTLSIASYRRRQPRYNALNDAWLEQTPKYEQSDDAADEQDNVTTTGFNADTNNYEAQVKSVVLALVDTPTTTTTTPTTTTPTTTTTITTTT